MRHDMDLLGLGPMFEEFSISLDAQRRNILPHESLGGCSPFSILFPTKTPPLHLFKPFGCHPTIIKQEAALLKKTQPRGLTGIYIGTALPCGQSGYPIWIPSEKRITTAMHAIFDEKNSRLAVSHHESTIFLLHYHQLTTNCSMIIYLSHITLRHLSIHRSLLSSHTHIPAMTINRWNSTQRAMTKNTMPTCLLFQFRKGIRTLQLQCQAANISTSTNSINSTQTLSTTRVT